VVAGKPAGAITMGVLLPDGVDLGHIRMVDGEL
jgi:hypothetical protein